MKRRSFLKSIGAISLFGWHLFSGLAKEREPGTIEELITAIESRFPVGQDGITGTAITGEPFVQHRVGEGEAVRQFWAAFQSYAVTKPEGSTLYRRERPNFEYTQGKARLRGRLLLSTLRIKDSDS